MRKTIFGMMFGMLLATVAASCGNKGGEVLGTGTDSTLVDTTVVDSLDTVVVDTLQQVVDSVATAE